MRKAVAAILCFFVLFGAIVRSGAAEPGGVAGTVRLAGEGPPARLLQARSDHTVCGSEPPATFRIDQRRCAFVPHVLIIPPGSTVEVLNNDGILHNFHTVSRLNPSMNLGQPGKAKPLRVTFERPEVVQVKCDVHGQGFMRAWIVVAEHPYYALTDDEGRFRLPDVPPGPHTLEVWHEAMGARRVPVTVGASDEVTVTVTFKGVAP